VNDFDFRPRAARGSGSTDGYALFGSTSMRKDKPQPCDCRSAGGRLVNVETVGNRSVGDGIFAALFKIEECLGEAGVGYGQIRQFLQLEPLEMRGTAGSGTAQAPLAILALQSRRLQLF
jgi:hypothetical protein